MKANKSATTKKRRMKKATLVDEENIDVVDVSEGERHIDIDVAATTTK